MPFFSVILAAINIYSVRLSARIQVIFTVTKLVALATIIIGGIVKLFQGTDSLITLHFTKSMEIPIVHCTGQ